MTAGITFGAAGRIGSAHRFGPRQFRRAGLDQKIARVVRAPILLRHPLDYVLAQVDGIKSHVNILLPVQPTEAQTIRHINPHNTKLGSIDGNYCLILNNLEKNYRRPCRGQKHDSRVPTRGRRAAEWRIGSLV